MAPYISRLGAGWKPKSFTNEQGRGCKMAKAFASQSLIGCQVSWHGARAGIVQPKQWRASLASPNPKSLFSEENRSRLIGWSLAGTLALGLSLAGPNFANAKIGVNKPALLPKEFSPVIDVAGFLSPGQGSMHGDVLVKIYRSQASVLEEKLLECEVKIELSVLAKNKSLKLDNHMTKLLKWLWACWKEDFLAFIEELNTNVQFLRLLTRSSLLLPKQEDAEDTSEVLTYLPYWKLMRRGGKGPCSMLIEAFREADYNLRQARIGIEDGSEGRLVQKIAELEKNTGYKLRILAQNYPDTPGLAVKDFWHVDEKTIIFVADPTFGNILHFNVGELVDANVAHNFWSRVAGKYGNVFYWKEKGEDAAIEAAVASIATCLTEPNSSNCNEIQL